MQKTLTNRQILLVVTGSIAAYKSPDIIRRLIDLGASVRVVLTKSGAKFITEQTLQTISQNPVHCNLWDKEAELAMGHIELAKWADCVLIAPISANTIASLVTGKTTDLLTNIMLATTAPIIIAPAMNVAMFNHQTTQHNLAILKKRNISIINGNGEQACGDYGLGRLAEIPDIIQAVIQQFHQTKLTGKRVIITAGGTIEAIDAVRFISNHSSGKMAFALAQVCVEQGAEVIFIYSSISTTLPKRCQTISTQSADEMYQAVMAEIDGCDIFISVAAVADYKAKYPSSQKLKRSLETLTLTLVPNKDILKTVCELKNKPFTIGFAAQSENLAQYGQQKYQDKGCDLLIANDISRSDIGFDSDENEVLIFHQNGMSKIAKQSKLKIAQNIIGFIADI